MRNDQKFVELCIPKTTPGLMYLIKSFLAFLCNNAVNQNSDKSVSYSFHDFSKVPIFNYCV